MNPTSNTLPAWWVSARVWTADGRSFDGGTLRIHAVDELAASHIYRIIVGRWLTREQIHYQGIHEILLCVPA